LGLRLIRKSSAFFPLFNAATSHLGLAPRPAQVSPDGLRYFGGSFLPFKGPICFGVTDEDICYRVESARLGTITTNYTPPSAVSQRANGSKINRKTMDLSFMQQTWRLLPAWRSLRLVGSWDGQHAGNPRILLSLARKRAPAATPPRSGCAAGSSTARGQGRSSVARCVITLENSAKWEISI
jgi:hypothetical protein